MASEPSARVPWPLAIIDGGRSGGPPPPSGGDSDDGLSPRFASDDAAGAELVRDLAGNWRYSSAGNWYQWDGRRWQLEKTSRIVDIARKITCRRIAAMIETASLAREVSSAKRIYSAVKLAATDRACATLAEAFDADPDRFNTPGGILDSRSGQLWPSDREALMTKLAGAIPNGAAPRFRQFMREITRGDRDLEQYLQRVGGYCLTGHTVEHAIFFLFGSGKNGKSTFVKVLQACLGDYARTASMDSFTATRGERHPTDLAAMCGARLVTAVETQKGRHWDEARLAAISGGDRIAARFMRGDFFEFTPTFKLMFAGNHKPRLASTGEAMRRRFHMIPFRAHFPKPEKDLDDHLRAELDGILAYFVEGAVLWRLHGLAPPKAVLSATQEYFAAENTIGRWIEERCRLGANELALTQDLHRDYRSWAARTGERDISEKLLAEALEEVEGLERWRDGRGRRGWRGVGLVVGDQQLPLNPLLNANTVPRVPPSDPAEEWER